MGKDLADLTNGESYIVGLEIACSKGDLSAVEESWVLRLKKEIETYAECQLGYLNEDDPTLDDIGRSSFEMSGFTDKDCIFGKSKKSREVLLSVFSEHFDKNHIKGIAADAISDYNVSMMGQWYIEHLT
jgi:hypothetical protein